MKRVGALCLLAWMAFMMFPVSGLAVYQDLYGGVAARYAISGDDSSQGYVVDVYADYWCEIVLDDESRMFYVGAGPKFSLMKTEFDDEPLNAFIFYIEPELEWMWSDLIVFDEFVGLYFLNKKVEDSRENGFDVTSTSELRVGNLEEDVSGFSPWGDFMEGYQVKGIYWRQLYRQDADEKAEELDHSLGGKLLYAYFHEDTAFMLAPSIAVTKHLNDAVDECLTLGLNLQIAIDLSDVLALDSNITLTKTKADSDADVHNEFGLNLDLILNSIEKLEITPHVKYTNQLDIEGVEPVIGFGVDVNYELWVRE